MSEQVRGMVVYHRGTLKRGKITASNNSTGMVAVAYDDGTRELVHVTSLMNEKIYREKQEEERANQMALKPEQAVIGATVYASGHKAPLAKGKIASPIDNTHGNNIVIVEWSDGRLDKRQIRTLLSEVDGAAENQRMLDEQARLEEEFDKAQEQCRAKLAEAAKLVNEAAALASDVDSSLQEMYDVTGPLERAMGNAGWRTSSWGC